MMSFIEIWRATRGLYGISRFDEDQASGTCRSITGGEAISDAIMVDQSPLARTPRSTPAVYIGAYDAIRELFGTHPNALSAGLSPSSFSFNTGTAGANAAPDWVSRRSRCNSLSDLYLRCPECQGRRFQPHVLQIRVRDRSIHDVLEMTVTEAIAFFHRRRTHNACLSASSQRWVSIIFASVSRSMP